MNRLLMSLLRTVSQPTLASDGLWDGKHGRERHICPGFLFYFLYE
jgi:hypothetical protein